MGLETGTFLDDLVRTNPLGTDDRSTADDHLRLIKDFILNTLPNLDAACNMTPTELNRLVGLLASAAELNILDGATLSTAELNFVDGVTSLIQTQLNGKAASAHSHTGAEISALDAADTETGTFVDARIPNLNASKINAGEFALARIPTIDNAKLGTAAVARDELKTTTSEVSRTSTSPVNVTMAGGEYQFYPRTHTTSSVLNSVCLIQSNGAHNSYLTVISLQAGFAAQGIFARSTYVQASPPYDLGDGDIPLFIFVEVEPSGNIITAYEAPEAPWHHNGPTDIVPNRIDLVTGKQFKTIKDLTEIDDAMFAAGHARGLNLRSAKAATPAVFMDYLDAISAAKNVEIEITQAYKNADMPLLPRPMEPGTGNTVVMLDPVSPFTQRLFELKEHEEFSICELLHDGDLIVDNTVLPRAGPPGVDVVSYRFR